MKLLPQASTRERLHKPYIESVKKFNVSSTRQGKIDGPPAKKMRVEEKWTDDEDVPLPPVINTNSQD